MAIKAFRKKRGSKLCGEYFFKDHFNHTHGILKNAHGHLVWEKFVLFFSFFFLIYTKLSLKKPVGGRRGLSAPHL